MHINFNFIPEYRIWRNGTNKKIASKGRPGSKLQKKMVRQQIKTAFRKQSLLANKGKAL